MGDLTVCVSGSDYSTTHGLKGWLFWPVPFVLAFKMPAPLFDPVTGNQGVGGDIVPTEFPVMTGLC